MENLPGKSPAEIEEEKKKLKEEESQINKASNQDVDDTPKVSRAHDFTHTHPTHARHRSFGIDHEPGAAI